MLNGTPIFTTRMMLRCYTAIAMLTLIAGCSKTTSSTAATAAPPTQVAARVNRQELTVHEINTLLPALNLRSQENTEQASQKILEQIINQTLAQQKALGWQLDQNADVVRQLETTRRGILAQAWADRVLQDLMPPPESEQRRFYDTHPEWFAQRNLYQLQDLWADIQPEDQASWQTWLKQNPNYERVMAKLKSQQIRYATTPILIGSEHLSAAEQAQLANASQGQRVQLERSPARNNGLQLWWLIDAQSQPIRWEQAQPLIENKLMQQQRQERLLQEINALRKQADIQYVGAFASANQRPQP